MFYRFSSKLLSSTFQVEAIALDKYVKSDADILDYEHNNLLLGFFEKIQFPVIFNQIYGKKLYDLLDTGWPDLYLISSKLRNILIEHNLSGWKEYPVEIYDKKKNIVAGYHGFSIVGKCGKIDYSKCEVIDRKIVPNGPIFKYYKGLSINTEEWDSSDFFIPHKGGGILINQDAFLILKKHKLTNIVFENLADIEIDSYTFQLDSQNNRNK